MEEVKQQGLVSQAITEARVFKVPEKTTNNHHNNIQYIGIFDINRDT